MSTGPIGPASMFHRGCCYAPYPRNRAVGGDTSAVGDIVVRVATGTSL